jgi:Leucine-rich repeat (LRR) protein
VALCSLYSLKSLRLGGNAISRVPDQISQLTNLKNLDLSKNELYELGDSLFYLTTLTDINVHWNCIALVCFSSACSIDACSCLAIV